MNRFFSSILGLYKVCVSPFLRPACIFSPTCSVYAAEALKVHGVWYGGWLALRRIVRCHPWGNWTCDPVPHKVLETKRES